MNEKDKKTVESIIFYCNRMQAHVNRFGNDKEIYLSDIQFQDACSSVIIHIGEFVGRLSDEFKLKYSGIPWSKIVGMRNIHAHNYESVIDEIIWETIQEDVPYLKQYLENLLNE